jgi:pimeloyl-ACP methyl ester carboxylesterase
LWSTAGSPRTEQPDRATSATTCREGRATAQQFRCLAPPPALTFSRERTLTPATPSTEATEATEFAGTVALITGATRGARVVAVDLRPDNHAVTTAMQASTAHLSQQALLDRLKVLGKPLQVIFGDQDRRWRPSSAADYRVVPGAKVELLPGAGHTPILEDPPRTAALLRSFAEIHTARSSRPYRVCRVSPLVTCRSCVTWAFLAVSWPCHP